MQVPEKTRPRLFLVDGYALIYRAFFAMISRPLMSSRGENTSAAWGLTKFLLKVLEEHRPDYLGVVFDAGTSDRHEIFAAYKATREKMPGELEAGMPRIREIIDALHIPVLTLPGYEADDVIGTLALQAVENGLEAVIISGDKDFYQLIRDGVCLLNPGRGGPAAVDEEWVGQANAHERLGVPPERVVDYLGLIGDSSDNIPGVPGIGPKTAIQLIEQFGPVEEILARVDQITAKRPREALRQHAESALLSKKLVTIRTDLPIELDLAEVQCEPPDRERLKELFLELEFQSLVREYGAPEPKTPKERHARYRLLQRPDEVDALVARIREAGRVAVDTATIASDPMRAELVGISLAIGPGDAYYLPLAHGRAQGELIAEEPQNLPDLGSPLLRSLVDVLRDPAVAKIGHNLKYDVLVFRRAGVDLRGIAFDTMVASYLLDPGSRDYGLETLALRFLDHTRITYDELTGKGKSHVPYTEVPLERCRDYACEASDIALQLADIFAPRLVELHLDDLFRRIEMPLVEVLAEMEWTGIRIDEQFFEDLRYRLASELRDIEQQIYAGAGTTFNINSNPQLREILFDRLKLPVVKRTKTGASTDATVLEELAAQGHELPIRLSQYRQLDKLQSTYVEALPRMVNPRTGRIHTFYNQTIASTGRLSSSDPNIQNIPIRTELGAEIRRGFVPAAGCVFVSADYSQIELRVLAHYSQDPAFVEAFRAGLDIHRQTAALVFGVATEEVTRQMRDRAKTVNFAVIYGIGPFSLAQKLGTATAEAKEFIERYFERFPGVRRYLDEQIEKARRLGYVETLSGRRRYIPEVSSRNFNMRAFGERAATNAPVQGSSADLIKMAMIEIHRVLLAARSPARMLLQVHDELLFETPRSDADALIAVVKEKMEGAAELHVPLVVETGVGDNWLECK